MASTTTTDTSVLNPIQPQSSATVGVDQPGPGGHILTVGTGMEFANLSAAIAAAHDNDVIAVQAGTYVDQSNYAQNNYVWAENVTIEGVGGMVHYSMGPQGLANGKGLLVAENGLTVKNFELSGATDGGTGGANGSLYGNVAGIRVDAGSLTVENCYIHNNQDGILGGAAGGSIVVDHSEIADNGAGDGYTHNMYINRADSFTLSNSYVHGAYVGHEVKSRAMATTIVNSVIADGPNGTASYSVDIPDDGVVNITNTVIEKGPNASNYPIVHYGGEPYYAYPDSSLTLTGDTIINDHAGGAVVLNQAASNGLNVTAQLSDNTIYNVAAIANGPAAETNDTDLTVPASAEPAYSTVSPWASAPIIAAPTGPLTLLLDASGRVVSGGNTGATITDTVGSNTITSGNVGITLLAGAATYETVTTLAGSTNTLTFGGKETVVSAGHDTISLDGNYSSLTASGTATITATANCYNTYVLNGAEILVDSGAGNITVGATGNVVLDQIATYVNVTKQSGGALSINPGHAGLASASFSGGAMTFAVSSGSIVGYGSSSDGAADTITFNGGNTAFTDGLGADTYVFVSGHVANASIGGFRVGTDTLTFQGFAGNPVTSWAYTGGNTVGTLADGTTITLAGVNVPQPTAVTLPPPPPPPPSTVTLTTSGNTVTGGATMLTVNDKIGGNIVAGGAGGLTLTTIGGDRVSTASAAADTLTLASGTTVASAGTDKISLSGGTNTINATGNATVTASARGNTIRGGAGTLAVTDTAGGNTIAGGAGGVVATVTGSGDTITTAAGSAGTLIVGGGTLLNSAGNDAITVNGTSANVTASGGATITGTANSYAAYTLNGAETLDSAGGGLVSIGASAHATVNQSAGSLVLIKAAGGQVTVNDQLATAGPVSATVTGGAANITTGKQGIQVVTNGTVGDTVAGGAGAVTVVSRGADTVLGGSGTVAVLVPTGTTAALTFIGGSGDATVAAGGRTLTAHAGAGALTIAFGSGTAYVQGGGKADVYSFANGHGGGTDIISGYRAGTDQLAFSGYSGSAIQSQSVSNGSLNLVLTDNTHITLAGATHL